MKTRTRKQEHDADDEVIKDVHFKEIGRAIKPDAKNRITLGKFSLKADFYSVFVNAIGQIVLDPRKTVPAHEAWLYENPKAFQSVQQGIREASEGKLHESTEDFSRYVKDE